jgi:release factor glutamine methyltransferase
MIEMSNSSNSNSESPMTIREAFSGASSFLRDRGVEDSRFIAELLLRHWLGWDRSRFYLRLNDPFPADKMEGWTQLLERKAAGEPAQYIIGEQEFYGLPFHVSPAVLIPRPETEILVEHILRWGDELWPTGRPTFADVGTGSGAIPITVAAQRPSWRIHASDISLDALAVAEHNAIRNELEGSIAFVHGDLLEPYSSKQLRIDILVSNPPYIPSADIHLLQPEVRLYEPRSALDGGQDGLALYRRLLSQLADLPAAPRLIGFEVGMGQADNVKEMLVSLDHWDDVEVIRDLAGIDRHVIGVKRV